MTQERRTFRRQRDKDVYAHEEQRKRFKVVEIISAATLLIVAGALIVAIIAYNGTINDVQKGRRESNGVTCAAISAVALAGKSVITREAGSQGAMAGAEYVDQIGREIDRKVGAVGDHLVLANGTLDCALFAQIAKLK